MSTSTNSTHNDQKVSSEKSVRFSADAARYEAERAEAAAELAAVARQKPHNFCVKKGKWYDCLRPVPGYMGGGIVDFDAEYKKKNVGLPAAKRAGQA